VSGHDCVDNHIKSPIARLPGFLPIGWVCHLYCSFIRGQTAVVLTCRQAFALLITHRSFLRSAFSIKAGPHQCGDHSAPARHI
jgi:hypothetical protein